MPAASGQVAAISRGLIDVVALQHDDRADDLLEFQVRPVGDHRPAVRAGAHGLRGVPRLQLGAAVGDLAGRLPPLEPLVDLLHQRPARRPGTARPTRGRRRRSASRTSSFLLVVGRLPSSCDERPAPVLDRVRRISFVGPSGPCRRVRVGPGRCRRGPATAGAGRPDDVCRVAVQVVPVAVVAAGGAGVGVPHRVLHVLQRHALRAGGGGERVPQRVRRQPSPRPGMPAAWASRRTSRNTACRSSRAPLAVTSSGPVSSGTATPAAAARWPGSRRARPPYRGSGPGGGACRPCRRSARCGGPRS